MGRAEEAQDRLVQAVIGEVALRGSLDVPVSTIAKRAGVSSGLAFHYFGDKEGLFLAAMRHVLAVYGAEVRAVLRGKTDPYERLVLLIDANFSPTNFSSDVIAAWLNFYVLALQSSEARRLLGVYHRRLHSNLVYNLRPLTGKHAVAIAHRIGALIDGIYLRFACMPECSQGPSPASQVRNALDSEIGACR